MNPPNTCAYCSQSSTGLVIFRNVPVFNGVPETGSDGVVWSEFRGVLDVGLCPDCVTKNWQPQYVCGAEVKLEQVKAAASRPIHLEGIIPLKLVRVFISPVKEGP